MDTPLGFVVTVLAGVAVVAAWRRDCRLHPYVGCKRCGEAPKERSRYGRSRAFGYCRTCGGSGRRRRLGARFWGIDPDR